MNNKIDNAILKEAINKIKNKYGKDSIYLLGDNKEKSSVSRLATGFEDFDNMLEGGIPKSRVIEISGPEGAGKTSICLAIASKAELTAFIDAEGTLDDNRANALGVDKGKLIIERPESGEEICDAVVSFVKANIPLIVIDSVPSIVPHDFLDKILKDGYDTNNIAGTARLLSQKLFPTLIPALKFSDSSVIFINQVREKIGVIFGETTFTPGGRALKHYSAVRIQVSRKSWFGTKDNRIGQLCSFKVVKSKVSQPFKECELCLHFSKGFITHDEMKKYVKELKCK